MSIYITRVKAIGVHDRFDFDQKFQSGVNLLYGTNGVGKTTFLHIIANALNSDFQRFKYLKFRHIEITYSDNNVLSISWNTKDNVIRVSRSDRRKKAEIPKDIANGTVDNLKITRIDGFEPLVEASYIPAFRLLIDAWVSSKQQDLNSYEDRSNEKTLYARKVFGEFIPQLSYPAITEVIEGLTEDLKNARLKLANLERRFFLEHFVDFYSATSDDYVANSSIETKNVELDNLINELDSHPFQEENIFFRPVLEQVKTTLSQKNLNLETINTRQNIILDVCYKLFSNLLKYQQQCYENLDLYLAAVNNFLVDKKLIFAKETEDSQQASFCFKYKADNQTLFEGVKGLSSGEHQILSLLYACYTANEGVILIDEPEISLHIDWQRKLLDNLTNHSPSHQLIICTHSPIVPADYDEELEELQVSLTDASVWEYDVSIDSDYTLSVEEDTEDVEFEAYS